MEDDRLVVTRLALHALAERVISPLRVQATGNEIALEVRPGGFATPELPAGGWAGVLGTDVVRVDPDGDERRAPILTLRAVGEHVGLLDAAALPDDPLRVDAGSAATLATVLEDGDAALRALLAEAAPDDAPSEIHLWPEHFDVAIDMGAEGARATFGVSPGDGAHPRPYAYVVPWDPPPPGAEWQAAGFTGAERPAGGAEEILAFWRRLRAVLRAAQPPRGTRQA
jgi:hypothetical protein